ncbi:MAG: S4 domain-containing protein [Solitalea-like symbiont of Acarus siro]
MSDPGKRLLQKELANELTTTVHSKEDANKSAAAAEFLFGNTTTEFINSLSDTEVEEMFYSNNIFTLSKDDLSEPLNIINLIVDKTEIIKSRSEARRLISQQGVLLNKAKVLDDTYNLGDKDLLNGKYLIIQKVKKYIFNKIVS